VSFDDWILALHLLSAFALVAGIIVYWVLIFAIRRADTPDGVIRLGPLAMVAQAAVGIGALGTIVLGVWLAFSVGDYDIWDGWIIAAIVLWLIATGLGQRRRSFSRPGRQGRTPSSSPSTARPGASSCSWSCRPPCCSSSST
jgi:hypothetical protein